MGDAQSRGWWITKNSMPIVILIGSFWITVFGVSWLVMPPPVTHEHATGHSGKDAHASDPHLFGQRVRLPIKDYKGRPIPNRPVLFLTLSCSSCQKLPAVVSDRSIRPRMPLVLVVTDEATAEAYSRENRNIHVILAKSVPNIPTSLLNFAPQAAIVQTNGVISEIAPASVPIERWIQ